MRNFIFDEFAKLFTIGEEIGPVELTAPNTFKIALLNDKFLEKYDKTCIYRFNELQLATDEHEKFEVTDKNESYEPGGEYVLFHRMSTEKNASDPVGAETSFMYTVNSVIWTDTRISGASCAVIYREKDGLLISCHDFNKTINTNGDDIKLDWTNVPTIVIRNQSEEDLYEVNQELDIVSTDPVASRTLTYMFKDLGVIFTDDLGDTTDVYPKVIPTILPEDEFVGAGPFDENTTYYIKEIIDDETVYVKVENPVEEDIDSYFIKQSYTDDWLNSMTYMTSMKPDKVNEIFDEILSED